VTSPSDVPEGGIRHAEWELPEVLAAVIMVAFVIIAITAVVAGIVDAGSKNPGLSSAQVVGEAMETATAWANPAFAFILVVGVGLVWWQVRIWSAEIDVAAAGEAEDVDLDAADSPVLVAAFDHLLRAKSLVSWALPLLVAVLTAAAASVVASFLLYRGQGIGGGEVWSNHVETIGFAAATWVLVLAGLLVALYVRTQVSHEFTLAEEAASSASASPTPPVLVTGRSGDDAGEDGGDAGEDGEGTTGTPPGGAWAPDDEG